jgi:hypothetical protein
VERQRLLNARMKYMASQRCVRLQEDMVGEWRRLTRLHRPRKMRILACVENMVKEKSRKLVTGCMQGWWRVSVGPESGRWVGGRVPARPDVLSTTRLRMVYMRRRRDTLS